MRHLMYWRTTSLDVTAVRCRPYGWCGLGSNVGSSKHADLSFLLRYPSQLMLPSFLCTRWKRLIHRHHIARAVAPPHFIRVRILGPRGISRTLPLRSPNTNCARVSGAVYMLCGAPGYHWASVERSCKTRYELQVFHWAWDGETPQPVALASL